MLNVAKGHNIALTSRAMQNLSNITEPDCVEPWTTCSQRKRIYTPTDRSILPHVEVELNFIRQKPLQGSGVNLFKVLAATGHVVLAIEIVDWRIKQFDRVIMTSRKVFYTIADYDAHARIVMGARPVKATDVDLR